MSANHRECRFSVVRLPFRHDGSATKKRRSRRRSFPATRRVNPRARHAPHACGEACDNAGLPRPFHEHGALTAFRSDDACASRDKGPHAASSSSVPEVPDRHYCREPEPLRCHILLNLAAASAQKRVSQPRGSACHSRSGTNWQALRKNFGPVDKGKIQWRC